MKILRSMAVKTAAFLLMLICAGAIIASGMTLTRLDQQDFSGLYTLNHPEFKETWQYRDSVRDLYSRLCVLGEIYLGNTNTNGSSGISADQKAALQNLGILDENGQVPNLSENFIYSVSFAGQTVSNQTSPAMTEEWMKKNCTTYYYRLKDHLYASEGDDTNSLYNRYATGSIEVDGLSENRVAAFTMTDDKNPDLTIYLAPKNEFITSGQQGIVKTAQAVKQTVVFCIPLALLLFILVVFQIVIAGKPSTAGATEMTETDGSGRKTGRIFSEVIAAGMLVCATMGGITLAAFTDFQSAVLLFSDDFSLFQFLYSFTLTLFGGLFFWGFLYLVRRLKEKKLIRSSFTFFILRGIRNLAVKIWRNFIRMDEYKSYEISRKMFVRQVFFLLLVVFNLLAALFFTAVGATLMGFVNFLIAAGLVVLFVYLNNQTYKELSVLCRHVDELYKGNNDFLSTVPAQSPIAEPLRQLNNITDGIKKSVDRQIRTERMKIDLVTNVSHDLKTPLTSLIGFIDLLSRQDLPPESADYVKILEVKAERLKKIVSDLFDLAKVTSGNEDLKMEDLDGVVLIKQVAADMDDAVQASGKTLKMSFDQETAPIAGDGQKLYRAFQNLLDNALKYSLDGTRIFLELKTDENDMTVTMKNTASYDLDFDTQEILERFVRGDRSRTGDGNGLGLSIARGFINACGGSLHVDTDGDLFKVTVTLPLRSATEK